MVSLLVGVGAWTPGCGSEPRRQPPPQKAPVTLAAVEISPATPMLALGEALALSASGRYSDGSERALDGVTWTTSSTIARIDARGVLTARAVGEVEVRARFEAVTGTARVRITPSPLVRIAVEPGSVEVEEGERVSFTAIATFADATTRDVTAEVEWSSTAPTIATVLLGEAEALVPGSTRIVATARPSGISSDDDGASAEVTVRPERPRGLVIRPGTLTLPLGLSEQLTAVLTFPRRGEVDGTGQVTWSSADARIAEVDASGLLRTRSEGLTSIAATDPASGLRASISVAVGRPAVLGLVVTPTVASVGVGGTLQLSALATYTDGQTRDVSTSASWASSDVSVATVSDMTGSRGRLSAVAPGTVTVSASDRVSGLSSAASGGSATITVLPPTLTGIAVLPLDTQLPLGATQQYQAVGLFSNGSSADLTAVVSWASSDPGAASVDRAGLARTLSVGRALIRATDPLTGLSSEASNRSAELVVLPPALVGLSVTPSSRSMVVGSTLQLVATGRFSDGVDRDLSSAVQWSSSSSAVRVSGAGLLTADALGSAQIIALDAASNLSAVASITVNAANLVSISVTPSSTAAPAGAELALRAIGAFDDGSQADVTGLVEWSVTTATVAEAIAGSSSIGRVLALDPGRTRVAARDLATGISSEDQGASARLSVSAATVTSLRVRPAMGTVAVGRTLAFSARGRFSDGSLWPMTSAVQWASSDPAATVSNQAGTRGLVTGVAVGSAVISALHLPSGVGSGASNQSAALVVELGIVTLASRWGGPTVSIDATTAFGVDVGSVAFAAGAFGPGATISDVEVAIDFLKTDGTCAVPASGNAYHNETSFRLRAPGGQTVILANPGTWSGGAAMPGPVTVVFDQQASAAPSSTPVAGRFRPAGGNLDSLDGAAPTGTWVLQAGDSAGGDPLCVLGYTVTITAQ
jgi:uncharacterized protein YjdB